MQNISRAFLLLVAVAVVSCASSNSPQTTTGSRPGVGSTYIFSASGYDSTGTLVTSDVSRDTFTVIASGITYQGKTNVVQMSEGNGRNMVFLNYESNGDVSRFGDNGKAPGGRNNWLILPIASKGRTSALSFDSSYVEAGALVHRIVYEVVTYLGTGAVTAAGRTFNTTTLSYFRSPTSDGIAEEKPETISWSDEIGFMVRDVLPEGSYGETRSVLVSYVKK